MTTALQVSRRRFLAGSTAATAGLVARLPCPVRRRRRRAGRHGSRGQRLGGDPARRHGRRAHRPLRDGPGHAHRPRPARRRGARMRLVEGHDRISDPRPEPRAQPRLGQTSRPAAAAASASRNEYVRKGGAAARDDADPGGGRTTGACRPPNARAAKSVITHTPSGRTTTYGKVAEAAGKLEPPKDIKLKDPKDWKIAGKPLAAARHGRQAHRQAGLRHRPQAAGHAQRRDQGLPGLRRQGEELRRRQGRRACRASRRWCRSATPPSPSSPTPGGAPRPRSTRCRSSGTRARTPSVSSADIAAMLKEGLDADARPSSATRPATPRRRSPAPRRRSRRSTATRTRTTPPWSR